MKIDKKNIKIIKSIKENNLEIIDAEYTEVIWTLSNKEIGTFIYKLLEYLHDEDYMVEYIKVITGENVKLKLKQVV